MPDRYDGDTKPYRCEKTRELEAAIGRVGLDDLRLGLVTNGYRPVPVAGAYAKVKSPGKQPVIDNWREICAHADDTVIRAWWVDRPDGTNTGLLTGLSGSVGAADIDVLIPDVAADIADLAIELLGSTPLQRIGRAPKTLYAYRVDAAFRKVKTPTFIMPDGSEGAVEFLAEGQQFVAFGTHPTTRNPYQWVERSPADVPADELPLVDLEAVETFIEFAAQVLRDHGGTPKPSASKGRVKSPTITGSKPASGGGAPIGDNFFSNVNGAALSNLGTWVPGIFGSKARLQPGTGAYRIRSEDLRRDLDEDLSIHPEGAWDFGLETPVTPIDLAIQYGGKADVKDAALWLCEQIGVDPASLGWGVRVKRSPETSRVNAREPDKPDGLDDMADGPNMGAGPDILAEFTDPVKLAGIEPPAREWVVEGWLPVGTVTSLYGAGGVGKTLLAQLLQSAVGTGRPFLGVETKQCKVLSVFCEDDEDELHRRQMCINASMGIGMQDLGAVRWQSRFGKTNVMATIEGGLLKLTEFYGFVRAAAKQSGARLVIIDNVAQVFAGNENIRAEVTQFVNSLGTIAQEIGGAVLLLGHPGKADNSEYSGSTAWDACVRSRWILERPKADLDEQDGQDAGELADLRVLRRAKANYARKDDEITMRWEGGTFRTEGPARWKDTVDRIEERLQEKADDAAFLACLDALSSQGRSASHSKFAANYAPKIMSGKPETKSVTKRRLEQSMERLFTSNEIIVGVCGRGADRKPVNGIVRAPKAEVRETCGEPAGDLREGLDEVREGCGKAQDETGQESAKSLKSERETSCGKPAGNLREGLKSEPAKSLKSERESCGKPAGGSTPLYTTYIEGGTLGAVPPLDDTEEAAELSQLHRILANAIQLADLAARLELCRPVVPDVSGVKLLERVEP